MTVPIVMGLIAILAVGCGAEELLGDDADAGGAGADGGGPSGSSDGGSDEPDWPMLPSLTVCAQDADYSTIQAAIDAAQEGQVIEVCAGTYPELLAVGKAVQLVGLGGSGGTIIDAQGTGSAVTVTDVDVLGLAMEGFTIQNGDASLGGGIRCSASALTLHDC